MTAETYVSVLAASTGRGKEHRKRKAEEEAETGHRNGDDRSIRPCKHQRDENGRDRSFAYDSYRPSESGGGGGRGDGQGGGNDHRRDDNAGGRSGRGGDYRSNGYDRGGGGYRSNGHA
ncbi:hypothetical protein G6011_00434 [Alternaria panax]|uniref:Uncharacterized protein n=1 Tax=Alternaria panax TaxID=48097 RepID=A0AAD4IJ14_9PLEO|nr:hypothetical protein G6011_00434 [Alternaria panax]